MKYVIGVDCGGTKTEAEAYSLKGELLASVQTNFGNLVVDYGIGLKNIKKAIDGIFDKLPVTECQAITLGIAGIDSGGLQPKVQADLRSYHENITLINDGQLAHYSILKGHDGITVTAGTGSVILGLQDNQWYRVGGWGHLFGDEGSAYFIAKSAIQQALKEYDLAAPPSKLSQALFAYFKAESVFELTKTVYGLSKGEIAAAATVVANLATQDEIANKIILQVGEDLSTSVLQLIDNISPFEPPVLIGLNGSVIEKNQQVLEVFMHKLDETDLIYELQLKKESCAKGAYYLYRRNGAK